MRESESVQCGLKRSHYTWFFPGSIGLITKCEAFLNSWQDTFIHNWSLRCPFYSSR